jgi:hypothetical protein
MNDFLSFRRMITPVIIQIIFWIGAIGIFIAGIVTIATAHNGGYYGDRWEAGILLPIKAGPGLRE